MFRKIKSREKISKKQKQAGEEIAELFTKKILPLMEKGDLPSIEVNQDFSQYGVSLRMTITPVIDESFSMYTGGVH